MIIAEALNYGVKVLKESGNKNPSLDAKILMKDELNYDDFQILNNRNISIDHKNLKNFKNKINRRKSCEPIAYIINKKDFWKNTFFVSSDTLIPRPDSEIIIESLMQYIPAKEKKMNILDLGTGSGCLIISALQEYPNSFGKGIDISLETIRIAKKNQNLISNKKRLVFEIADFSTYDTSDYDIIIANPPYVSVEDKRYMNDEVLLFEPHAAIFPPNYSEFFYEKIITNIKSKIKKNCYLFFEIDYQKSKNISKILENNGFNVLGIENDLSNKPRCIVAYINK